MRIHRTCLLLLIVLSLPTVSACQTITPSAPASASLCDLLKSPKVYDGKQIQIRGKINLEFEDFSIYDTSCNTWPGIWLMFGGDVSTPTKSTVNDNRRPQGQNIKVNGIEYIIVKDQKLDEFSKGITARQDRKVLYRVIATLAGTFLAGGTDRSSKGIPNLPGYGHLGCCYLFIIQKVLAVETKPITDAAKEKWSTLQHPKP
jgi:hypothetical protein